MKLNKHLLLLLITLFSVHSFCRDTLISVPDGYAWGEIGVEGDHGKCIKWYNDTITFSCGARITFYDLNSYILHSNSPGPWYLWSGGLVILGTYISSGYKYNDSINRVLGGFGFHPAPPSDGGYTFTDYNIDTNWNNAHYFPDSIFPIDTFYDYKIQLKAVYLFITHEDKILINSFAMQTFTNYCFYKPIIYLKTINSRHIKLQMKYIKICMSPYFAPDLDSTLINSTVDSIFFIWAADSCGNGKFKHPALGILNDHTKKKPSPFFVYKAGSEYFLKLDDIYPAKELFDIIVYDIKGRKIFFQKITTNKSIKLSNLKKGIYLATLSFNNNKFVEKIIISR